jgi:hypothetical protein
MRILEHYPSSEFGLAVYRYRAVTKKSPKDFMEWIGFVNEHDPSMFVTFSCAVGTSAHKKMEMLLNRHWYTLLRAHLIQEDQNEE